jgi:hypothetical protein
MGTLQNLLEASTPLSLCGFISVIEQNVSANNTKHVRFANEMSSQTLCKSAGI